MRILGDERGLMEMTGEGGTFLLVELMESLGLNTELWENGWELELPLLLRLDSLIVLEVLDSPVD